MRFEKIGNQPEWQAQRGAVHREPSNGKRSFRIGKIILITFRFLPDPGVSGVRSMGPGCFPSQASHGITLNDSFQL